MTKPRVRFAPSPTGYMHIGNLRTALYNWLYARHTGGSFILRIEDTDRTRHNDDAVRVIIEGLRDLGLAHDEGPYFQSERLEIYQRYAQELIDKGFAIRTDRGDADKGEAVVLAAPTEDVWWVDEVKGGISFAAQDLQELVILKSDGFPTYNFACAIDDHEMGITHVLRGDDHVSNTPKQIAVYRALDWEPPKFAHLPMIMGMDGQKLSKRHGSVKVTEFLDAGYLPHVLLNFIALLGWSPGDDLEIMPMDEMVRLFEINRVRPTASRFDYEKLAWMNGHYLRMIDLKDAIPAAKHVFSLRGMNPSDEWLLAAMELYRERMRTLVEFADTVSVYLIADEDLKYTAEANNKVLSKPGCVEVIEKLATDLAQLPEFTEATLEPCMKGIAAALSVGFGKVAQPVRVALTGGVASPEIFRTMMLAGKDMTVRRLVRLASQMRANELPIAGE